MPFLKKIIPFILLVTLLQSCSIFKKTSSQKGTNNSTNLQQKMATLLQVAPSSISNISLYSFVDKWLYTPYLLGGQTSKGIDCSSFTQTLYRTVFNKQLPRTSEAQYNFATHIKNANNLHEGDLVFFNTLGGKRISHVGVYLQNNKFVSATNSGVLIADLSKGYWAKYFVLGGKIQH
jgi:cell wall-associated NlpC family hydrolase